MIKQKNIIKSTCPFSYSWEQRLYAYKYYEINIFELEEQIEIAESNLELRGVNISDIKLGKADSSKFDRNIIDSISEIDFLKDKIKLLKIIKLKIDRNLERLSEENRKTIENYYINQRGINWIMNEFYLSRSGAYKKKEEALAEFILYVGGNKNI